MHYDPEKLKELLETRGISQVQLATDLNYDPSTLSRILRGKQPMSHHFAIKAASYFDIPYWWFSSKNKS